MKQLLDCLPAIIFFIFFKIYDIYVATAALIVASILQIAFDRLVLGKFTKMHNWLFLIPGSGISQMEGDNHPVHSRHSAAGKPVRI